AGTFKPTVWIFDQIPDFVAQGKADAGLIIHEGQLTYHRQKLHKVIDLGEWWKQETNLPLPLGGNCIRRDLGDEAMVQITGVLKRSIEYGLSHREQAVEHALSYARDMGKELADRFVGMYVNEWTVDYGQVGREAVGELLRRGHQAGLIPDVGQIDFIGNVD
ncbi:MAG: ABC transporter substrate-binding protein, partial [Gemmatimonadetes bacterium]|nr:ABC transporter substrate-binding protein [Gemmatimonadota bacterium]